MPIYMNQDIMDERVRAAFDQGKFAACSTQDEFHKVFGELVPELLALKASGFDKEFAKRFPELFALEDPCPTAASTTIDDAAPSAKKRVYVISKSAEQIANWTAELSRLSPKNQAKWRGKVWHITGFVMPVRWNKDVQSYEIGTSEPLKKHNPTVHFPKGDWAPVVQDRIMPSDETMAHYYEPEVFTRGGPTPVYVVRQQMKASKSKK